MIKAVRGPFDEIRKNDETIKRRGKYELWHYQSDGWINSTSWELLLSHTVNL